MLSARLFTIWTCWLSYRLPGSQGQAIVFDVLRNSSAVKPNDTCASLACFVKNKSQEVFDVHQVISLTISETEDGQRSIKHIAGLSFFDNGVKIYGDSATVSGNGQLSLKGGHLYVYIKGVAQSCQTGIFSCELRFIDSESKGHVIKVDKKVHVAREVVGEPNKTSMDVSEFKELKILISDEMTKIKEQFVNATSNLESVLTSVSDRLLRLESAITGDLQSRLDAIDLKQTKFEVALNEDIKPILTTLTEIVDNSTKSIKSYTNDKLDIVQNQMATLEESVRNERLNINNLISDSFQRYSKSPAVCDYLQANLSTFINDVQNHLSSFTTTVMRNLSSAQNQSDSFICQRSARIMMEAILRMANNLSSIESKLSQWKTELGSEIQETRLNISSHYDNMAEKHDRFSREIKENVTGINKIVNDKFLELTNQKQFLLNLEKDVKGKLLNIDINLNDIKVVLKNIRYFFGV